MNKWKILLATLCMTSTMMSFGQTIFNDGEYPNSQYLQKDQYQYIDWRRDHIGVSIDQENYKIEKTAPYGWNNSFLCSENIMKAGTTGYVDVAPDINVLYGSRIIGISYSGAGGAHSGAVKYGFYIGGDKVYVREGTHNAQYLGKYIDGDVFRIENVGGSIRYYKNNALAYISTVPMLNQDMRVHAVLDRKRTLDFIATSFQLPVEQNFKIRNGYDVSGLLNWQDSENLKTDENSRIVKSSNTSNYDSGARSTNFLAGGQDGVLTINTRDISGEQQIGLRKRNVSLVYPNPLIDYTIRFYEDAGDAKYVFSGPGITETPLDYNSGDVFTIERLGNDIVFKKVGETPTTITLANNNDELEVSFSLKEINTKLHGLSVSENFDQVIRRNWLFETRGGNEPINYQWDLDVNNELTMEVSSGSQSSSNISYMAKELWARLVNFSPVYAQSGRVEDLVMTTGTTSASAWGETIAEAGEDISMSFVVTDEVDSRVIGFSTQSNLPTSSYSVRLSSGSLYCMENGYMVAVVPNVEAGTKVKISRLNGNVYYEVGNSLVNTAIAPIGAFYPYVEAYAYITNMEDIYVSVQPSLSVSELATAGTGNLMCYAHTLPLSNACGSGTVSLQLGIAQAQYPLALKLINTETATESNTVILAQGDPSVMEMGYWGVVNFEGVPPQSNYVLQLIENYDSNSDGDDDTIEISYADVFVESAALWDTPISTATPTPPYLTSYSGYNLDISSTTNLGVASHNYLNTSGEGDIFIRPKDFSSSLPYIFIGFEDQATSLVSDYTEQTYGLRLLRISPNHFRYHVINDGNILQTGVMNNHDFIRIRKENGSFICFRDNKLIHEFIPSSGTELKINVISPKGYLPYIGSTFCLPLVEPTVSINYGNDTNVCSPNVLSDIEVSLTPNGLAYSDVQINSGQQAIDMGSDVYKFENFLIPGDYEFSYVDIFGATQTTTIDFSPTYGIEDLKDCIDIEIKDFICEDGFSGEINVLIDTWGTGVDNYSTSWAFDDSESDLVVGGLVPSSYNMQLYGGPLPFGPNVEYSSLYVYSRLSFNTTPSCIDEVAADYYVMDDDIGCNVSSINRLEANKDGLISFFRYPFSNSSVGDGLELTFKVGSDSYGFRIIDINTIEAIKNGNQLALFDNLPTMHRCVLTRKFINGEMNYYFEVYEYSDLNPITDIESTAKSIAKGNYLGSLVASHEETNESAGEAEIVLHNTLQNVNIITDNHKMDKGFLLIQSSFCAPSKDTYYAFMKRKPDGGRHEVVTCGVSPFGEESNGGGDYFPEFTTVCTGNNIPGKRLLFQYDESYYMGADGSELTYEIFDYKNELQLIVTDDDDLMVYEGDNRYGLDVSSIEVEDNPYYLLVVTNNKNEKRYLRFKMPAF